MKPNNHWPTGLVLRVREAGSSNPVQLIHDLESRRVPSIHSFKSIPLQCSAIFIFKFANRHSCLGPPAFPMSTRFPGILVPSPVLGCHVCVGTRNRHGFIHGFVGRTTGVSMLHVCWLMLSRLSNGFRLDGQARRLGGSRCEGGLVLGPRRWGFCRRRLQLEGGLLLHGEAGLGLDEAGAGSEGRLLGALLDGAEGRKCLLRVAWGKSILAVQARRLEAGRLETRSVGSGLAPKLGQVQIGAGLVAHVH